MTWIVVLVTGLALLLIVVPGDVRYAPYRERLSWWDQQAAEVREEAGHFTRTAEDADLPILMPRLYEHGWPRPFIVRAIRVPVFGGYYSVRPRPLLVVGDGRMTCSSEMSEFVLWSSYDNWPLESAAWRIHPANLAIDALLALLIVGTLACATEWWICRRCGIFRFRIVDLLAATTVIALFLGWQQNHERSRQVERQVVRHFQGEEAEKSRRMASCQRYSGPEWLRRLLGHESFLPQCRHIHRVDLGTSESWSDDMDQIARLPYLKELAFHGPFPKSALRRLEDCPRLATLFVDMYDPSGSEDAARQANAIDEMIGPADLDEIELPQVRRLTLRGRVFLVDDIQRALAANRIELLDLYNVSVTVAELDSLRGQFAETRIFINWPSQHDPPEGNSASVEDMKRRRARELGLIAVCDPRP